MSSTSVRSPLQDWKKVISVTAILVSLVILIIAHLFPTCQVNATAPITNFLSGEVTEVGLEGSLTLYGFDVKAGVEGGMVGEGMTVENERLFVQGPGPELPERLGLIMNSYKDREHKLNAKTILDLSQNPPRDYGATIIVRSHIDRIPFWLDGIEETITITVSVNESYKMSQVNISKVWIEVWTDFDEGTNHYTNKKVVWEKSVNDVLRNEDDEVEYTHNMTYESSQERIGIVARVNCTFIDTEGNPPDEHPSPNFSSDKYPHPHTVYLATHSQAGRVVLMVAAFPMFIIAGILALLAVIFIIRDNKKAPKYVLVAGILVGLGMFFYWWGVITILKMTEVSSALERMTSQYFEWNWAFYLLIPASLLLIANSIFMWIGKVVGKNGEGKTDEKDGVSGEVVGQE